MSVRKWALLASAPLFPAMAYAQTPQPEGQPSGAGMLQDIIVTAQNVPSHCNRCLLLFPLSTAKHWNMRVWIT